MVVQQVIENYIKENILFGGREELGENIPFHKSGVLDSTGFLELITFIEERFGILIADDEVIPENFDTLRRMHEFVQRKLRARAAM